MHDTTVESWKSWNLTANELNDYRYNRATYWQGNSIIVFRGICMLYIVLSK
jgi:hypothetical protein